jgi:adenine-specific DNA-methyltransferase
MNYELHHGDCLDIMPRLEAGSINLIACDLPYFGVKADAWDNQWASRDAFLQWVGRVCDEWKRLLAPNGSVYAFASPKMAWYVEGVIRERFNVLNRISWIKEAGWHQKSSEESLRCYFPQTEPIFFAENFNSDNIAKGEAGYNQACDDLRGFVFEPIRAYLRGEFDRAGVHISKANEFCNTASMAARHYFTPSQWCLPTAEHYKSLQDGLNTKCNGHGPQYLRTQYEYLRTQYEDLRTQYEDLRTQYEDLRRPFNATPDAPYTDVWTFPTVNTYPGKHPTEKPISLMEHIVSLSSRPGDVVLDCCMGFGTTGQAAGRLGRKFIGIELGAGYFAEASGRVAAAYKDWGNAKKIRQGKPTDTLDLPLFT